MDDELAVVCLYLQMTHYIKFMKQDCVRTALANTLRLQDCQIHKLAKNPGIPLALSPRCCCCHLPYEKQQLPLFFSQQQTQYLGPGVALYFRFLLISTFAIIIPTLAISIITIITNIRQESTSQSLFFRLSNLNSVSNYNKIYSYILAGVVLGFLILLPILIKFGLKIVTRALQGDKQFFYPQFIALLFKLDRPANLSIQQVTRTLNQWHYTQTKILNLHPVEQTDIVQQIYFSFNMEAFEAIQKQINELEKQRLNLIPQQNAFHPNQFSNYDSKYNLSKRSYSSKQSSKDIYAKINKIDQLKQKIRNRSIQQTNKFIVVFKNMAYRQLIRERTHKGLCQRHINKLIFPNDNPATVHEAPFPSEIKYHIQHVHFKSQKLKRRVFSWLITISLALIGGGIQYLAFFLLTSYSTADMLTYLPLFMAAVIYFSSQACSKLSLLSVPYELQPNQMEQECSSNTHSIFIGITLKCVSVLAIFTIFESQILLVETVSWFSLIWFPLTLIGRLINFNILVSFIKRSRLPYQIKKGTLTQQQANKSYEKPQSKMSFQYSQLIIVIFISFFYASTVPFFLIVSSIFILASLLVQRLAFAYIYSQPHSSSYQLFSFMSTLLWKSIISLILGQFYYIYLSQRIGTFQNLQTKILFSVLLVLSFATLLVPSSLFKPSLGKELTYEMVKDKFVNTYQEFNIMYSFKPGAEVPKSAVRLAHKSEMLAQELNTMSKSLETTLRDKLFHKKNPCLEVLNNRDDEDSLYFQFDNKVKMPQKSPRRQKSVVPPIFKQNRQDLLLKKRAKREQKNTKNLVKLTNLAGEEEAQIKNKIKTAIRGSIGKIS